MTYQVHLLYNAPGWVAETADGQYSAVANTIDDALAALFNTIVNDPLAPDRKTLTLLIG